LPGEKQIQNQKEELTMENLATVDQTQDTTQMTNNNRVMLHGTVVGTPKPTSTIFGEGNVELGLSVNRLSSIQDILPITVPKSMIENKILLPGMTVTIKGQFRSYNQLIDGRSKLMLTVFVREVIEDYCPDNPNVIELVGYVCKQPIYRTTPFNREIADILIAVNRTFGKSDYIPSIAWGRNARFADELTVGEKVYMTGRIQSREYQKKLGEDKVETRIAYEVSVGKLSKDPLESVFNEDDTAFIMDNEEMMETLGLK